MVGASSFDIDSRYFITVGHHHEHLHELEVEASVRTFLIGSCDETGELAGWPGNDKDVPGVEERSNIGFKTPPESRADILVN